MAIMIKKEAGQTDREELLNTISHGIAASAAIGGCALLIIFGAMHPAAWSLFSMIVYGTCLILVYTTSTFYHYSKNSTIKKRLRIADHACIFLMIAGTYTPILLITIGGVLGWVLFAVQWILAISGILLKIFFTGKYEFLSILMYITMGWLAVFKIDYLHDVIPEIGFWLLIVGGLSYTLGIIFYLIDCKMRFAHFIWHLFVIKGSVLHFLVILLYV